MSFTATLAYFFFAGFPPSSLGRGQGEPQEFGRHITLTELSQLVALIGCGGPEGWRPTSFVVQWSVRSL